VHEIENFRFCADVDAARGLIEQEDFRLAKKPFCDDYLQLIAAA